MKDSTFIEAAIKEPIRKLAYHPRGAAFGVRSKVLRPWRVSGASKMRVGSRVCVLEGLHVELIGPNASLEIGDGAYIGRHCYITAIGPMSIGADAVLADHVYLTDVFHGMLPGRGRIMDQPLETKGPLVVGYGCFLGYRAAVMPGVSLGEHCVVGANSVVTRSFPDGSVVCGSPARLRKRYDAGLRAWVELAGCLRS